MIGPVIEVRIVIILEEYGLHIFRCDIQRNRAFFVWNSRDEVTNCSQPLRSQKEGNLVVKKEDPTASRKLVLLKGNKETCANPSGTLWWCSNKTRNDGIHIFSTTGRSLSFTGEFRGIFNLFWGVDFFREEKKMTKLDKQSFSHLWIRSVTTQVKRNLMMITLFHRKYTAKLVGNTIKEQFW